MQGCFAFPNFKPFFLLENTDCPHCTTWVENPTETKCCSISCTQLYFFTFPWSEENDSWKGNQNSKNRKKLIERLFNNIQLCLGLRKIENRPRKLSLKAWPKISFCGFKVREMFPWRRLQHGASSPRETSGASLN